MAIWELDEAPLAFADTEEVETDGPLENDEERQFVSLFNGRDLAGWVIEKDGSFSVRDGVIHMDGRGGWLRSEREYKDFELRLEFRFTEPGGDTGIFLRYHPQGGYQVQTRIQDRWGGVRPRKREEQIQQTHNTDYVRSLVKKNKTDPDAWHTYEIVIHGDRAIIHLDGEPATDATGLSTIVGYIGLQGERPTVQYRNIRIRDLSNQSEQHE